MLARCTAVAVLSIAGSSIVACGRIGYDPRSDAAASDGATSSDGAVDMDSPRADAPSPMAWLGGWTGRKPIDFLSSMVPSTLASFPAFVGLAMDVELAATAANDGADLRFTKNDGLTGIPFEIESFDPETGRLAAWVNLYELSSTTDTRVYLYYGNPTAPPVEDPPRVWQPDHLGVWHLGETPTVDAELVDSRGTANLTAFGGMSAAAHVEGRMGSAIDFDGVDDRLSAPGLPPTPVVSISAWVRPRAWPTNVGTIAAVSTMEGATNHDYFIRAGVKELNFGIVTSAPVGATSAGWSELDSWHFVAGTYDGTTLRLYQDGVEVESVPQGGDIRYTMLPFHVGSWGVADPERTWNGQIDEVRVSSVARTADWYRARFANESDPARFHRIGPEERAP